MARRAQRLPTATTVLPAAASALLIVAALVALTGGAVDASTLLILACVIVAVTAAFADLAAIALIVVIAEFTAIGFARRPYAQLRGGPHAWHAALALVAAALPVYLVATYRRRMRLSSEQSPGLTTTVTVARSIRGLRE